jgi:hypothetical protein
MPETFPIPRPPKRSRNVCTAPDCTAPALLSCSRALTGDKAGTTCDRALCQEHAHPIGAGAVLCPAHARAAARGAA